MDGSKCKHCGVFISGTIKKMAIHLVKCEADRPYSCKAKTEDYTVCGRRFATQRGLNMHLSDTHTGAEKGSKYLCRHAARNGCMWGTDNLHSRQVHEEKCGTNSYRRRSRSRSRGPSMVRDIGPSDDNGRAGDEGQGTTPRRTQSRSTVLCGASTPSRANSRGAPGAATPSRANSRGAAGGATPSRANSRGAAGGATPSRVSHANNGDEDVSPDVDATRVVPAATVDDSGLYALNLLDPPTARNIMYQQHQSLDDLMKRMGQKLDTLKAAVEKKFPHLSNGLSVFEDKLADYNKNWTAEALEASGKINLGIAERAAASATAHFEEEQNHDDDGNN